MDVALLRQDIAHLRTEVTDGFSRLETKVDLINGSVRQHETRLSLLEEFCRDRVKPALEQVVENRVQIATVLAKWGVGGLGAGGGLGIGVFLIGKATGWW